MSCDALSAVSPTSSLYPLGMKAVKPCIMVCRFMFENFSLTEGHHFVHLSVHMGPQETLRPGRLCQRLWQDWGG